MKNAHRPSLMVLTVLTAAFLVVDLPLMAQMGGQQRRGQPRVKQLRRGQQGAPKGAGTAQIDKSSPTLTPQQERRVKQLKGQAQSLFRNLQRVVGECQRVQADAQGVLATVADDQQLAMLNLKANPALGKGQYINSKSDEQPMGGPPPLTLVLSFGKSDVHVDDDAAYAAVNLCEQLRGSVTVNYQTLTQHARSLANPTPSVPNVPTISEESGGKREDMFVTTQSGSVMVVDAGSGPQRNNVKTDLANVDMQNVITKFEEIKVTVTGLANQEQRISGQLQQIVKELEALGIVVNDDVVYGSPPPVSIPADGQY